MHGGRDEQRQRKGAAGCHHSQEQIGSEAKGSHRGQAHAHAGHRFLHRMLVQKVSWLAEEAQVKVAFVAPRGTSAWAYDGSGKVRRDKKNYSLCRFANGKRYNADYNAVSNIAARYLARMLDIVPRERPAAGTGKSSGPATRMPFVLADIWANALV